MAAARQKTSKLAFCTHLAHFFLKILAHPNKCLTFAPSVLAKPLNNAQIVRGVFYL